MPRNSLPQAVKEAIVRALAAYDPPSVVARGVNEEFGLRITRQAVERYDPTKAAGVSLSPKLKALFEESRQALLSEKAKAGTANRAVRIHRLQRLADRAEAMGHSAEARACLRQIAEEEGGLLTNARIVKAAVGVSAPKSLADFYAKTASESLGDYGQFLDEGSLS